MKIKLSIPNSLFDVKVSSYQEYLELEDPQPEDIISTMFEIPRELVDRMPAKEIKKLLKHWSQIDTEPPSFQLKFELNGTEYGFIPNLDDSTWGEHRDILEFMEPEDWHKQMGVMYRPITRSFKDKYAIEDYEVGKLNEVMRSAPLSVAIGAQLFFYDITRDLLSSTLSYLAQYLTEEEVTQYLLSTSNGLATLNSSLLQAETFFGWKKHQDSTSIQHSVT